jgi:hypothetical protein
LLRDCPARLADLSLPEHYLDPARPILQVEEMGLAHGPAQNDAAGGTDTGGRSLIVWQRPDCADRHVAVKTAAPGIDSQLVYLAQLVTAAGFKDIWRFRHGMVARKRVKRFCDYWKRA